ncbi:hypothetical protein DSO57_1039500 [Entomophthora muscae]|uniref:Uncharacterized protein n=1 Tax=Entomophthora muscae TaxID=34485 RepID=A0ACC2U7E5_9FUNG|nr:hypothetical protein DSO57_1039500 [Entomophthora muscae]
MYIVCVVAGTGTLGLPFALNQGGWLLIECLYCREGERLEEFSDVGRAAFGTFGYYFVKVFQYSITLSAPCIYILFLTQPAPDGDAAGWP